MNIGWLSIGGFSALFFLCVLSECCGKDQMRLEAGCYWNCIDSQVVSCKETPDRKVIVVCKSNDGLHSKEFELKP
jgi:hypothetical protein